ncbi:MAG: hypothetical protein J2P55_07945, partial [Rhizobiales bacterium]|nr:hypothetical protein [Hyphomicrobiales bacterium]
MNEFGHQSMTPKRPAPGLDPTGGCRFSEKIMLNNKLKQNDVSIHRFRASSLHRTGSVNQAPKRQLHRKNHDGR